jgi:hypothetical protein
MHLILFVNIVVFSLTGGETRISWENHRPPIGHEQIFDHI